MSLPPIVYVAGFSIVIVSLVGFLMFRRLPDELKPLTVLFGIHAAVTISQFLLASQRINNIWTSHVYNIIEMMLLLGVFSFWMESRRAKLMFRIVIAAYAVIWTLAKIFIERFDVSPVYTPTLSRVILAVSSLYVLMMVATTSRQTLLREPKFWFAAGVLLSCVGSLMFYGFRNFFNDLPMEELVKIWTIHWVGTIMYNILFLTGFAWVHSARNTGGQLELAQ